MPIVNFQKLDKNAKMPEYATTRASGADLFSSKLVFLEPMTTKVIPTGLRLELPDGYEAQVRSKSGLASRGIFVTNSPGTVDNDYRGELKVILTNFRSYFDTECCLPVPYPCPLYSELVL